MNGLLSLRRSVTCFQHARRDKFTIVADTNYRVDACPRRREEDLVKVSKESSRSSKASARE